VRMDQHCTVVGKKPKRPCSYGDDLNESPTTVHDQPVEIEEERPVEENSSIEAGEPKESEGPPVFEE